MRRLVDRNDVGVLLEKSLTDVRESTRARNKQRDDAALRSDVEYPGLDIVREDAGASPMGSV